MSLQLPLHCIGLKDRQRLLQGMNLILSIIIYLGLPTTSLTNWGQRVCQTLVITWIAVGIYTIL